MVGDIYILLWLFSNPLLAGLWIGFGCLVCYGVMRTLLQRKSRPFAVAAVALIYFSLPLTWSWGARLLAESRRHQHAWLTAKCKETMAAAISPLVNQPVPVDGFLDMTNQDKLMNVRLGRSVSAERERVGPAGTITITTGSHSRHPYTDLYRGAAFGSHFSDMARRVLLDKRFSYVEFVLLPEWFGQAYANAGLLFTDGWSGVKYRRYYLAPSDHVNCVGEVGDGRWGRQITLQAYAGRAPQAPEKPFCLALEVTSDSISAYTLTAGEEWETFWTILYPRGIPIPTWATVRLNTIVIRDRRTGDVVSRFEGFDYPDELSPSYRCNNHGVVPKLLETALRPDPQRTFLQKMNWYVGSGVQRYYEQ